MEHHIEVEFIHRRGNPLDYLIEADLVQTKPFLIGFVFRNRGNTSLIGARITNIVWRSASGQQIFSTINKEFHLEELNLGEQKKIWIEKVGTYVHGLCYISMNVLSDDAQDTIKTYQINPFTRKIDDCEINNWHDFFFIRSKNEYEQSFANLSMIFFAGMSVVFAVLTYRLSVVQTIYTEEASRSDRIQQEQAVQSAVKACKHDPTMQDSGLYDSRNGSPVSCKAVLEQYK
ncbi:MAG: hypothetical protein JO019_03400 [Candidatus Kaiserbacteria bacterium]|nr:hypothetical protein [Candidatus Kaiserbacteria bacterium]